MNKNIIGRVVGHMFGDGGWNYKTNGTSDKLYPQIYYGNSCQELVSQFKEDIRTLFPNATFSSRRHILKSGKHFENVFLRKTMICNFFIRKAEKINNLLQKSSFASGFLNALFDDDGNIQCGWFKRNDNYNYRIDRRIRLITADRSFGLLIQKTLLRFNIKSTIHKIILKSNIVKKTAVVWHILIKKRESILIFIKRIGFNHPRKRKISEILISIMADQKKMRHLPNIQRQEMFSRFQERIKTIPSFRITAKGVEPTPKDRKEEEEKSQ